MSKLWTPLSRRCLGRLGAGLVTVLGLRPDAMLAAAEHGSAAFTAFVDTLLPADADSPGATSLGVDGAIWQGLQRDDGFRNLTAAVVAWLDDSAQAADGRPFATLSEAERARIVSELAAMPAGSPAAYFFALVLDQVYRHYYARAEAWPALGYAGPPQPAGFPDHAEPPG